MRNWNWTSFIIGCILGTTGITLIINGLNTILQIINN